MRRYAGFVLMVLVAACTDKDKIPSDVLPREKMEKVMWDMMQADQYAGIYLAKDTIVVKDTAAKGGVAAGSAAKGGAVGGATAGSAVKDMAAVKKDSVTAAKDSIAAKVAAREKLKMETLKLYQEVFALHKVTREEFARSYTFYQGRPDLTRGMFDSLIAKGNRLRTENYNRPPGPSQAATPTLPRPAPIQPTSTNSIKTNIPGGLIKNQPGNRIPALQRAPGSPVYMPQGKPLTPPTAAPGQGPAGSSPGFTPKLNDSTHKRKKMLPAANRPDTGAVAPKQ